MGKVVFEISSLNKTSTLNKLVSKGLCVKDYRLLSNNKCQLTFNSNQTIAVKRHFKDQSIPFNIKKYKGFSSLFNQLKTRGFFYVGMFLCLVLMLLLNNKLLRIQCLGCNEQLGSEITDFITDEQYKKFSKIDDEVCKNVETILLKEFSKISKVSVMHRGNTLIISVKEKLANQELEFAGFQSIVAPYDGYIEEFDLVQGFSKQKVGNLVKKGDVLVFPYVFSSANEKLPIFPKANIEMKVFIEESVIHNENEVGYFETGNQYEEKMLSINDKTFYSQIKPNVFNTFNSYKAEKMIIENNLLPIKLTILTYKETQLTQKHIPFVNVKDELIKKATQNAYTLLPNNAIINSERINIKENLGNYKVSCILETIIAV